MTVNTFDEQSPCRFRARFDTQRQALANGMASIVAYHCPIHDCWHARIDHTQPESDTPT